MTRLRALADRRGVDPVTVAHAATLLVGFVVLLVANREQWFFGDDWDLLLDRRATSIDSLLRPHNEHWSTIPILVFRGLLAATGLQPYLAFAVPALLAHVVVAHLAWRLLRRHGVDGVIATAVVVPFLVLGAGHENLLWAFQFGFNLSLAAGLLAVLLVDHDGPPGRRDAWAAAAGLVALMSSGLGVIAVGAAAGTALLRRRWRASIVAAGPPTAAFLAWLAWYGGAALGSGTGDAGWSVAGVPRFVWTGLAGSLEEATGLFGWGLVLVVALAATTSLWSSRPGHRPAAVVATAIAVVGLFAIVGLGRSVVGVELARSPRYVHAAAALLLPAVGVSAGLLADASWARRAPVLVALALVSGYGWVTLTEAAAATGRLEQTLRARYAAAVDLARSGADLVDDDVDPRWAPNVQIGELVALANAGDLDTTTVEIRTVDRLQAAAELQVELSDEPNAPLDAAQVIVAGTSRLERTAVTPCLTVLPQEDAQIALSFTSPAAVELTSAVGGETVLLLSDTDGSAVQEPRITRLPAGAPRYLSVSRPGSTVFVEPPSGGELTVCGATVPS